jgi:CheY-like chemotaxis protein
MPENRTDAKTILVVDDVSDNRILLSLSLQDMGYRVLTACDGEEAVTIALRAIPDLILMDIAMPQLDGLEATRRIHDLAELRNVPVVAVTAFDTSGFRKAAFDAGFDGYLTKPIDFERLHILVDRLLSQRTTSEIGYGETTELDNEETTEIAERSYRNGVA